MAKQKRKRNEERENRITMEIVVDAYGSEERAMSWHYYLEGQLEFPFAASCIEKRATSPLRPKDVVEVIGMPDVDERANEIFVTVRWDEDKLAVPLSQLQPNRSASPETKLAVEDWHYWVETGRQF